MRLKTKNSASFVIYLLVLIIFANSATFSMDIHACEGKVESISSFGKAKVCKKMAQSEFEKLAPCYKAK